MPDRPPVVQSFRRDESPPAEPRRGVIGLVAGGLVFGAFLALCGFLLYMELDPDRRDRMRDWPVVGVMLAYVDPVAPEPPVRVVYRGQDPAAGPGDSPGFIPRPAPRPAPVRGPAPAPAAAPAASRPEGGPEDPATKAAVDRVRNALPAAMAHIQEERSAAGFRLLEEALAGLPEDVRPSIVVEARAWMGIALFDLGRDSEGERVLEDLATRHQNTRAIGELARHYYDIDRFDLAELHLDRLAASRVEGTRAAEYQKQVAVMKGFVGAYPLAESEHCRVRYLPALGVDAGRTATTACEEAWAAVQGRLSLPLTRRKMPIVILPRAMADPMTDRKKWAIGFFSTRVFILLDNGRNPDLRSIVRHEVVHGMFDRAGVRGLPTWLFEGLAVWFEDAPWRRPRLAALERDVAAGSLQPVPPAEFGRRMADAVEDAEASPLYVQAGSVVAYLFRRHGNRAVRQVLLDVRARKPVDDALRSAIGTDTRGLFTRWQDDLVRQAARAEPAGDAAGTGFSPRPVRPRRRRATASLRRR